MRRGETNWTTRMAKRVILKALVHLREGFLEIACPEQTYSFGKPGALPHGLVVVHDERMFSRVLFSGEIGFGESYMEGEWTSPDPASVVGVAVRNMELFDEAYKTFAAARGWFEMLRHRLRANTLAGSRKNIGAHYDLGNDFYRLFLDENLAYSCAYYQSPTDTLEQAQLQKFDRICRKLRLRPEDHLLEIGTGWGGFAAYAATRYGCRITTTTISRRQHDYAAEWFARLGDAGRRIELVSQDYRNLTGRYDKLVSIEMFEAVGFRYYDDFFRACDRLLTPEGTMLLQTITIPDRMVNIYRRRTDWIQTYIFPGAELASVAEILRSLARATRLSLFHSEDIGMHYVRTLETWRERFFASLDRVRALGYDERFIRTWDYYLACCAGSFRERYIGDVQLVLTKNRNQRPLMDEPWAAHQPDEAVPQTSAVRRA